MKKFFMSVLLVLGALTSAVAEGPGAPIVIIKKPKPPVSPIPGTRPLSSEDESDVVLVSANLTDEAVLLYASSATFARISVVYESGMVVYDQMDILGNEPAEITTLGWPSGFYTLYVEVGEDFYEGSFEL